MSAEMLIACDKSARCSTCETFAFRLIISSFNSLLKREKGEILFCFSCDDGASRDGPDKEKAPKRRARHGNSVASKRDEKGTKQSNTL